MCTGELGGKHRSIAEVDGAPVPVVQAVGPPAGGRGTQDRRGSRDGWGCGGGRGFLLILRFRVQIEQFAILGAFEVLVEGMEEPEPGPGVPVSHLLDDRTDEDQLTGAALTFGGGDAVLGAADLIFESALFLLLKAQELFLALGETIL